MESNQLIASNQDKSHKSISRWQLLELIGLASEGGLEGTQIRQILAAEYGVNPDYTSRVLVELVQKGYLLSQPTPIKSGAKGGRHRKVYIRTEKTNDLPDKPIPRETSLAVKSDQPSQAPSQEGALASPVAPQPTQQETQAEIAPTADQEPIPGSGARRRHGRQPDTEAATLDLEGPAQSSSLPEAITLGEGASEPSVTASGARTSASAIPSGADAPRAPVDPAATHMPPPSSSNTPASAMAPGEPSAVHDALATAMDQFSDLLLLQVAHKLGAFVANQMAPLERATGELCAQIDAIRTQLDAITQHLGTLAATPVPVPHAQRTAPAQRSTPVGIAIPQSESAEPSGPRPSNGKGQLRAKNGKKPPKTLAEPTGGLRPTLSGQRKLKALLIGVPSEQEQPIRERFGSRYDLLFLGAEVRYGKVRAIKDQYAIVLGLEDTCSPAIKDALKGHPHKAVLPRTSQLMDELEEYFQLHLEQSQSGSAD